MLPFVLEAPVHIGQGKVRTLSLTSVASLCQRMTLVLVIVAALQCVGLPGTNIPKPPNPGTGRSSSSTSGRSRSRSRRDPYHDTLIAQGLTVKAYVI